MYAGAMSAVPFVALPWFIGAPRETLLVLVIVAAGLFAVTYFGMRLALRYQGFE